MVEVVGKRSKKVPVLLTPDVKAAIITLTRTCKEGNVNNANPFVFALNNGQSVNPLRGNDALRKVSSMVDLQLPDAITSTNLQKYVATISQLVDMDKNEMEWLVNHLGHNVNIHKNFYRMQSSTLEMAVIGNLLIAVDKGRAHNFRGKNLRDITLQHFDDIAPEDSDSEDDGQQDK
ncbi:Hypothetical predicted protein, partial [Paramuricea clavata]